MLSNLIRFNLIQLNPAQNCSAMFAESFDSSILVLQSGDSKPRAKLVGLRFALGLMDSSQDSVKSLRPAEMDTIRQSERERTSCKRRQPSGSRKEPC